MDSSAVYKRKTGKLIAKNLMILLVLLAVAVLSIWAWFTQNKEAEADGVYAISRAEGVEVSWDGEDYYKDLTAITTDDVVEGENGLAKNLGNPEPLKLVTGNGTKFFEPYLNRRRGEVLLNSDGSWQGYDITEGAGKYIDIELHFRGTAQKDIYLAGDSRVSPKSTTDRISNYGPFSKDYICATSRVAFLDSTKQNCSFIWAPNADYKLKESDAGYTKVTEAQKDSSGGGTIGGLDGGAIEDGKDYYLWTIDTTANYNGGDQRKITDSYKFEYNGNIRYYVAKFTVIVPSYQADNPSIPFLISNSETSPLTNTYTIDKGASFNGNDSESLLKVSSQDYNAATYNNQSIPAYLCGQFYITKTNTLIQGTAVEIEFGFNPQTGVVTVLSYSGNDSWSKGDLSGPVEVFYYEIENSVTSALVNPNSSTAISTGENYKKGVQFQNSSTKLNVLPISVTLTEQFNVEKTGDGYKATYKFKNSKTNTYLAVSNSSVVFNSSGSEFSLAYVEGVEGPALKSGDYYVVFKDGKLTAVTESALNTDDLVTVYIGSSYEMITNLENDDNVYTYYDSLEKNLVSLGSSSTPKLFASKSTDNENTTVGTKIATLTKVNADDEYYTAHIVMRVWAEGTDRDAKTPLADGIFNTSFHFVSR